MSSAALSATMTTAAMVFAEVMVGMTDASTTRRPDTPRTLQRQYTISGPVGQVFL